MIVIADITAAVTAMVVDIAVALALVAVAAAVAAAAVTVVLTTLPAAETAVDAVIQAARILVAAQEADAILILEVIILFVRKVILRYLADGSLCVERLRNRQV